MGIQSHALKNRKYLQDIYDFLLLRYNDYNHSLNLHRRPTIYEISKNFTTTISN